eukprot:8379349-Alexandrium_andersonii.AAC.1
MRTRKRAHAQAHARPHAQTQNPERATFSRHYRADRAALEMHATDEPQPTSLLERPVGGSEGQQPPRAEQPG